jgi:hypothetical protein
MNLRITSITASIVIWMMGLRVDAARMLWNSRWMRARSSKLPAFCARTAASTLSSSACRSSSGHALAGHPHHDLAQPDARFGQCFRRDRAQVIEVAQAVDHHVRVAGQHEGAAGGALAQLDHPRQFQCPQRFAQRVAADVELGREIALGRQAIARLQLAAGHQLADLRRNVLERPLRRYGCEAECGSGRVFHGKAYG